MTHASGLGVGVTVGVTVAVDVGVVVGPPGVWVGTGVTVGVDVFVHVGVGVCVGSLVGVEVPGSGVGVDVAPGMGVKVAVGVDVVVHVAVGVGVDSWADVPAVVPQTTTGARRRVETKSVATLPKRFLSILPPYYDSYHGMSARLLTGLSPFWYP